MTSELKKLIELTYNRDYKNIYNLLNNAHQNEKGYLFEDYIKFLYEGNGWIVEATPKSGDFGADLYLRNPKNPDVIHCIIQIKNYQNPLPFDEVLLAVNKYEHHLKLKIGCNYFKIIALNGYVKEAATKLEFIRSIVSLESWTDLKDLITHYSKKSNKPQLNLFPHNEKAYKRILSNWKTSRYTCIVHATGTGKSYILAKILWKYFNKKIIVVAPSVYILDQIKKSASIYDSETIVFFTYSYLMKNIKTIQETKFDYIILDEFHRIGASKWGASINKLLSKNTEAKILGTSATPIRYLDNNRDMREEIFYGNISSELTLPEAIIKEILPTPKYIAAVYTLFDEIEKLKEKLNGNKYKSINKEQFIDVIEQIQINWERSNGVDSIIKKHLTKGQTKFIVFCENIQHLEIMESEVKKWFVKSRIQKKTIIYIVTSKNSIIENRKEIKRFELTQNSSAFHLLFSVDMLNEGIHIPNIDGVIFLRTTFSPIIFYQQIGRCLHVGNNRPVVFDLVNNFDCVQVNDFARMYERILKEENRKRKITGLSEICPLFEVHDETKNIQNKIKEIQNKYSTWEDNYGLLKEFYLKNDSYPFSKFPNHIEVDIEKWSYRQRYLYKNNRLDPYKVEKLESIEFPFTPESRQWRRYFDKYREVIKNENYEYNSQSKIRFENLKYNVFKKYEIDDYKNELFNKHKIKILSGSKIQRPTKYKSNGGDNALLKDNSKNNLWERLKSLWS